MLIQYSGRDDDAEEVKGGNEEGNLKMMSKRLGWVVKAGSRWMMVVDG